MRREFEIHPLWDLKFMLNRFWVSLKKHKFYYENNWKHVSLISIIIIEYDYYLVTTLKHI